ncbi:MAG: hypothetical protein Q4B54_11455, partial [Coriobacteriales bacterium]|nr:hypothetical protein [Coriobacteriales bacterium]
TQARTDTAPPDEGLPRRPEVSQPAQTPPAESERASEASPEKKAPNKMLFLGIGVAAVVLIGILVAVFGLSGSKNPSSGGTLPVGTASGPDKSLCVDSNGYVTVYAFTELSGQELLDFIGEKGYQFTESGGNMGWETKDQSYAFLVHVGANEDQVDEAGLAKLAAGGVGEAVWYQVICENYDTAKDALNGLGKVTFEKSDSSGDDLAYGIAKSSRGDRFFVLSQIDEDHDANVMVLNEDSIAAGILEDAGSTIDELYAWCAGTDETPQESVNTQDLANGVFTTRAVLSRTGDELATLAKDQGFSYSSALGGYANARQTSFLGVLGTTGSLDEAAIKKLPAGGGAEQVYFMIQGVGYASASAAFETLNNCPVLDWMDFSDYTGVGVIEGPDGKRYLAFVSNGESAEADNYTFTLFSDEAIAAGLLKSFTQQDFGASISEVWNRFTGGDVGAYSQTQGT